MTKWYSDKERFRALWEEKDPDGKYVHTARAIGNMLGAPNSNVVHAHAHLLGFSRRMERKSRATPRPRSTALSSASLPEGLKAMSPEEAFVALWNHYPELAYRILHIGRHFGISVASIHETATRLNLWEEASPRARQG